MVQPEVQVSRDGKAWGGIKQGVSLVAAHPEEWGEWAWGLGAQRKKRLAGI